MNHRPLSAVLVTLGSLLSGCACITSGHYMSIDGEVDPNMDVATLPVLMMRTEGQFNVHRLECGQVKDGGKPTKQLDLVKVPLDFCRGLKSHGISDQATFTFRVNGKEEKFRGFCSTTRLPSASGPSAYRVSLETEY